MKNIKKKQKHKTRTAVRTITKQVPRDSFFNFFSPPEGKIFLKEVMDFRCDNLIQLIWIIWFLWFPNPAGQFLKVS